MSLSAGRARVVGGSARFGCMTVVLTFYAADGFAFFFPGVELCLTDDESVSEENISGVWVIKGEYRVGDSLIS